MNSEINTNKFRSGCFVFFILKFCFKTYKANINTRAATKKFNNWARVGNVTQSLDNYKHSQRPMYMPMRLIFFFTALTYALNL